MEENSYMPQSDTANPTQIRHIDTVREQQELLSVK